LQKHAKPAPATPTCVCGVRHFKEKINMAIICGIEIKSSEANLVVLEHDEGETRLIEVDSKKIKLGDDESSEQINSFFNTVVNFVRVNHIDIIVIKKRAKKGTMAGGAVSFKIETLIQMNGIASVEFVSGQGIAAAGKKIPFDIPDEINKYQETAFQAVSFFIRKNM
jgi:uncharacterized protein related to proFAR isomerase